MERAATRWQPSTPGWVKPLILALVLSSCATAAWGQAATTDSQPQTSPPSAWQYGGFIDSAGLLDFNHPANQLFRSRGTAYKLDEPVINMAAVYVRKTPVESSRWGMELTAQSGQDTRVFGFSPTASNLPGYRALRHLGPTDVSYLLPVGKGLTLQGGIFNSLIGYDALYAKDNLSYTRPWGADFTPYMMLGVNASYPFTSKLTASVFVITGYFHLAHANHVPSWGGQVAYQATNHWTVKETLLIGPHQSDTAFGFWRVLSDSIAEWKRNPFTIAFELQSATEKVAPGNSRAAWVSSQLPLHWNLHRRWSATVRPEVAWDSDGRWTGFPQTVKAVTSTLEYRAPYKAAAAIFRLEHRFDDSRGPGGGFFRGGDVSPGVPAITPQQHLLVFAVILTFDGQLRQ